MALTRGSNSALESELIISIGSEILLYHSKEATYLYRNWLQSGGAGANEFVPRSLSPHIAAIKADILLAYIFLKYGKR